MWGLGNGRWAYVLYSPLNLPGDLSYRYCRNGQCGSADDANTAGDQSRGYPIKIGTEPQNKLDQVSAWAWMDQVVEALPPENAEIKLRGADFVAGVEFQAYYQPWWRSRLPEALDEVQRIGANWLILTPTWTFTRANPPVLEPMAGQDALWPDMLDAIQRSQASNLNVAVFPRPNFSGDHNQWWQESQRDFSWWQVWFENYSLFVLHHADLAARSGAPALILGGEWLAPALPGGKLADGSPSGVPADAGARWRNLLSEVRQRYAGKLLWAIPVEDIGDTPPFLDAVDQIYLLWSAPLSEQPNPALADLESEASAVLDNTVHPVQVLLAKPLILAVAYPSADGAATGCLPHPEGGCWDQEALALPSPVISEIQLDLQEQADVYQALLSAANQRDWISGFVTRGYYPLAALQDKSTSVHGKPAGNILSSWFAGMLAAPAP
jgi:hypothetical protein